MKFARSLGSTAVVGAVAALCLGTIACTGASASPADGTTRAASTAPNVGFLDSVSGHGPELGPTSVTLDAKQNGANLLVLMVIADGPDRLPHQVVTISDSRHHIWTERQSWLVFGSLINVYTSPGTGHDAGTVVTSVLGVHMHDEGQAVTVAAWSNASFDGTVQKNGSFGIPSLTFTAPAHTDTYTLFADGKHNRPITLVPGFHPVNVVPLGDATTIDHDLYEVSHLTSHDWHGGAMLTGNTGPVASPYWGIVDVNVVPAS